MEAENNQCVECADPISGRSDKRFCGDACRNSYNNRRYAKDRSHIKEVAAKLLRNRRILRSLIKCSMMRISENELIGIGFDPRYHTHVESSGWKWCYDVGYKSLDNGVFCLSEKDCFLPAD